jgi:hypothetical protein
MTILLILFGVSCLPALAYFVVPSSKRHGAVRILPVLSALLFAAAALFLVAVNVGWVKP